MSPGSDFIILEGHMVILWNEPSVFVHVSEVESRFGIVLGDGGAQPFEGGLDVARRWFPLEKVACELVLRAGVVVFGSAFKIPKCICKHLWNMSYGTNALLSQ